MVPEAVVDRARPIHLVLITLRTVREKHGPMVLKLQVIVSLTHDHAIVSGIGRSDPRLHRHRAVGAGGNLVGRETAASVLEGSADTIGPHAWNSECDVVAIG